MTTKPAGVSRDWFKWAKLLGSIIVLAGLGLLIWENYWYRTRSWSVLDQPISLAVGHDETHAFSTNLHEVYLINLEVDREVPAKIANEVLGTGDMTAGTTKDLHGFKLKWVLASGDLIVKQGMSDGHREGYWGTRTGRLLGWFEAEKGRHYILTLTPLEDGSQLIPYHPSLKVAVDLFTLDGYAMSEAFAEVAALILIVLGVISFLGAMVTARWKRIRASMNSNAK
jgi:hypothetical protein